MIGEVDQGQCGRPGELRSLSLRHADPSLAWAGAAWPSGCSAALRPLTRCWRDLNAAVFPAADIGGAASTDAIPTPSARQPDRPRKETPMPFTPEMRRGIDQIRDYLYGGGYPDPVSNAEQLSFLFFFYLIEGIDDENTDRARATEAGPTKASSRAIRLDAQNPLNAPAEGRPPSRVTGFRWTVWARGMSGDGAGHFRA